MMEIVLTLLNFLDFLGVFYILVLKSAKILHKEQGFSEGRCSLI